MTELTLASASPFLYISTLFLRLIENSKKGTVKKNSTRWGAKTSNFYIIIFKIPIQKMSFVHQPNRYTSCVTQLIRQRQKICRKFDHLKQVAATVGIIKRLPPDQRMLNAAKWRLSPKMAPLIRSIDNWSALCLSRNLVRWTRSNERDC